MRYKRKPHPPAWANWLLKAFCSEEVIETLQGDLYELYELRLERQGRISAYLGFIYDVFSAVRPFALKRKRIKHSNTMSMYRNYLKVSWRNLVKHKMYSAIKIGGLSIGIAACLLISLFVIDELSHDKNYPNADQIYRLINVMGEPGDEDMWTAHQPMTASMLKDQFPEVMNAGRLIPYSGWSFAGDNQVRRKDHTQNVYEEGFAYADQELLDILDVEMIYGDRSNALAEPNTIVISKKKADKYFPGKDPVGEVLILDEATERQWVIGGVMENPDRLNHLQFDFLLTLTHEEFWEGEQTNWCCSNYNVYMKLTVDADVEQLEDKMAEAFKFNYVPYLEERGDVFAEKAEKYWAYFLQPISDIHLFSSDIYDRIPHSDIKVILLFAAIALFVLLLACINFINLSTAKSANRAKEVGLRKVVGSFRMDLIRQFLTESIFIAFCATIIGLLLAWSLIPFFNMLSGAALEMPLGEWWLFPAVLSLTLIVGVISGLYPSFYLSSFRPIEVIRGKLSQGAKTSSLRGVMVVFQFTCSMVLIVSSLVVYQQMDFILNKDLGYDKEQVVLIQGANTLGEKRELFQAKLKEIPEVVNVTASNYIPVSGSKRDQNTFWKEGRKELDNSVGAQIWRVDDDYIETLGMNLIAGRDFDKTSNRDSSSIIINEKMVEELGLEDPIGARIENWQTWTVVGVVQNFHFESIRGDIGPLALVVGRFGNIVPVKVQTDNMQKTLASITDAWDGFMPHQPIRYSFMDDVFASMYEDVERSGNVFFVFSILAITVACLGLFGLSAFMVEQRSKEISIRKVLGASVRVIFGLLTGNFLRLITISMILAIPISIYSMDKWLEEFEYHIELHWSLFVISGILITVIALITISFESIKAAVVNPVKGLRSD